MTKRAFIKKLKSSGLSLQDAKTLKMKLLQPSETASLHSSFKKVESIQINYLDPFGKPLSDWPKAPPFYRLRYLQTPKDFKSLAKKKPVRYVQEPNTCPVAYYPANVDWAIYKDDPSEPLILTEGELKAAKACKEGFPTIGLGGVYNWRALKSGIEWISSLDYINWIRRNVYICFDSDYKTNPMVCRALVALAKELELRGSYVHIVSLPSLPNVEKVGLDDFLVHANNEAFEQLLRSATPLGLSRVLWSLNERYVYIRKPGLVVSLQEMDNKISPSAFKEHAESTSRYHQGKLGDNGEIEYAPVPAAAAWMQWPLRAEASRLTYAPGCERFHEGALNAWPGWGCIPKRGDVTPFEELIAHVFTGAETGAVEWFLRWLAYPLQYPGVKMFSTAVVHGVYQGTGKSLIGYTMKRIYGSNFTEIKQKDLQNRFNGWAENRQFAMGDDVTGSNKRVDADFLKGLITQESIRIDTKFIPEYEVPDCLNYYFTSNHPDVFFLEDNDRRYFIWEVTVRPRELEFYLNYRRWLNEQGGAEAVFDYLLNLDLGDFNPAAPAFKTTAKERMIDTGRSDLGSWVRLAIESPDQVLCVGGIIADKDLFTTKELLLYYDPEGRTGTTANGLGRELSRAGLRQVNNGRPVRTSDGAQNRYYAVRNTAKWISASVAEITEHLEPGTKGAKKRRVKKY